MKRLRFAKKLTSKTNKQLVCLCCFGFFFFFLLCLLTEKNLNEDFEVKVQSIWKIEGYSVVMHVASI